MLIVIGKKNTEQKYTIRYLDNVFYRKKSTIKISEIVFDYLIVQMGLLLYVNY